MTDILIYETGVGGDMKLNMNDVATVNGYENALYLAMFGGETWWGNYMTSNKYQSQTEQALRTTPLTSAGRVLIERAINADLAFLNNIPDTSWSVTTAITGPKRLSIEIVVNGQTFTYLWNPDKLFLNYRIEE